jgi:hypothetical protein
LQVPASKCGKTLKDLATHILKIPKVLLAIFVHISRRSLPETCCILGVQISPVVKPPKGEESENRTVILKSIINDAGEKGECVRAWHNCSTVVMAT